MRLNPDCIRDILLSVEDLTGIDRVIVFTDNSSINLNKYSTEEVAYHINQCEYSGLIIVSSRFLGGGCLIRDLTPNGHQFLADIRSDSTWNTTKEISKNIGTSSLDALKQIATGVVTELIKNQFHM